MCMSRHIVLYRNTNSHYIKNKLPLCALYISLLTIVTAAMGSQQSQVEQTKPVVDSVTKFSLDLYKHLAKERTNDNLFYSPTSIAAALAMTYMGSRNNTAAQIESVLSLKPGGEALHTSFKAYMKLLKSEAQYTLKLANKLFINDKYKLLTSYTGGVTEHYHTDVSPSDFLKNAEGERKTINKWVEKETAEKIKDLIPSGVINGNTALVLVNAIYFKGDWASKFKSDVTRKDTFHISSSQSVQVDMMYQEAKFNYGRDDNLDITFLELPYIGKELSMFVVLPNKRDGLSDLESKIDLDFFTNLSKRTHNIKVQVSLPKFKLEDSFELNDVMSRLGMSDLFDDTKSDLSGMDGTNLLYVSKALHKSYIVVNEEGSEAAAATAHVIAVRSLPRIERFHADHPFLFFIRDNRVDMLLFVGRFCKPSSSNESQSKEEL